MILTLLAIVAVLGGASPALILVALFLDWLIGICLGD